MSERFDSELDPAAVRAKVNECIAEYRSMTKWPARVKPVPTREVIPEQGIVDALTADERILWDRLPAADRTRLTREFRGGPITPAARSYLAKKLALLAPAPAVEEAAVEKQPASREGQ